VFWQFFDNQMSFMSHHILKENIDETLNNNCLRRSVEEAHPFKGGLKGGPGIK